MQLMQVLTSNDIWPVFRSEVSVLSCSSGQSCLHQWSTLCSAIGPATN